MNRDEIRKRVEGVIGVILVDKSVIQESSTLSELALDDKDIDQLFRMLDDEFDIVASRRDMKSAHDHPERMTLEILIDKIWKPDAP